MRTTLTKTILALWSRRRQQRQMHQLHRLSDHMLKDIGLNRSEIDGIVTNLIDGHIDSTRRLRGR